MPRILIVRGHFVSPWELGPWDRLPERFEVRCLLTGSNRFAPPSGLDYVRVRALGDLIPGRTLGEVATAILGDRYLSADEAFAWADIVHSEELSFWFSAEAARRRRRLGFRLVQTVWETLPLLTAFRNRRARLNRELVLAETDLFLAATDRAALALRLEGVAAEKVRVSAPGIDVDRFAGAHATSSTPTSHLVISPGRLVWEKGHQDVLRALALLDRGIVASPSDTADVRLAIIGGGPEAARLRSYARELGLESRVEIRSAPYDEMPSLFATASAMVLASQGAAMSGYHPLDVPRAFWEEQFGLVLVEAMASGLSIVTTTSGAIPEVVSGAEVDLVAPGDWPAIARALADGALSRPPGARVAHGPDRVQHYSQDAAAARLAAAYDALLSEA